MYDGQPNRRQVLFGNLARAFKASEEAPDSDYAGSPGLPLDRRTVLKGAAGAAALRVLGGRNAEAGPLAAVGRDADKYRAHAVKQGSRSSRQSFIQAMDHLGFSAEDVYALATLGYGPESAYNVLTAGAGPWCDLAGFVRRDDINPVDIVGDPKKVAKQLGGMAGSTVEALGEDTFAHAMLTFYAGLDAATLNALPDAEVKGYATTHPLMRLLRFPAATVSGAFRTVGRGANLLTGGYANNVTIPVHAAIKDLEGIARNGLQGVTNLGRYPIYLVGGGRSETADKVCDWALLVPSEYLGNQVQWEVVNDMRDDASYRATVDKEKGFIGAVCEIGGVAFQVVTGIRDYRRRKRNHKHRREARKREALEAQRRAAEEAAANNTPPPPPPPPPGPGVFGP